VHDLDGTLAKVTDDAPVILLAHEPDIFPRVPPRVSLTLSGTPMAASAHVRLLADGALTLWQPLRLRHIVEDNRHLVVSGGLGCSILPYASACRQKS
jgi:predicted MPP superfamily phosphohydrolase